MQNIMDNSVLHNGFAPVRSEQVNFRPNDPMVTLSRWCILMLHQWGTHTENRLDFNFLEMKSFQGRFPSVSVMGMTGTNEVFRDFYTRK